MGAGEIVSAWDKINGWMSPLAGAVDALMKPLVQPLADQFDSITGDSAEVRSTAQKWRDMGRKVRALGDFENQVARRLSGEWQGDAHSAFQNVVAQLGAEIDAMADGVDDVAEFLDDAAMEVETAEQLVEDIIRELIQWALITLAVSATLSFVTLGLSNLAGAGAAAAEAAVAGSRIATVFTKVAAALRALSEALLWLRSAEGPLAFAGRTVFKALVMKPVYAGVTGLDGSVIGTPGSNLLSNLAAIGADEYDDQVAGNDDIQTPVRGLLDNALGPLADGTRGPAQAVDAITDGIDEMVPDAPLTGGRQRSSAG